MDAKNKKGQDYRKYDFDDTHEFQATVPNLIEKVGGVGGNEYERIFEENNNVPLCDTTYGAECLETLDVTKLQE